MSFEGAFQADNWHREADSLAVRNNIRTRRWGMRVTVYTGADAGDYVLEYGQNSTDKQDNLNWLKVANIGATWGGGGVTDADNGLHLDGTKVYLGGTLLEPVLISGDDLYSIAFTNMSAFSAVGTGSVDRMQFTVGGDMVLSTSAGNINVTSGTGYFINMIGDGGVTLSTDAANSFDIFNGDLNVKAANTGNFSFPAGQLKLNNVLPNPALVYDQFLAADMTWHVPDSLWNGGGWASIEGGTGLYQFDGMTMIYGGSPFPGNAFGFSFYSAAPQQPTTNATFFITQGGTDPSEQGIAANTYNSIPIQFRADGQLRLWSNTAIDLAGDTSGTTDPVITLAGVAAPNATDYIGGDGQWHTAASGAAYTSNNAITLTSTNFQLGGPLVQDTLINGAGFDLILGAFITSPMDSFQSYAGSHFWSSRNTGTGASAGLTLNADFQVALASDGGKMVVNQTAAQTAVINYNSSFRRLGNNTNAVGLMHAFQVDTSGTAAAGFGAYNQWDMEVSSGASWTAMQDQISWQSAAAGAEYSSWTKKLTVNHAIVDVYSIVTSAASGIVHTFTGNMVAPTLPTSAAGLAAGTFWNNAGVVNIV